MDSGGGGGGGDVELPPEAPMTWVQFIQDPFPDERADDDADAAEEHTGALRLPDMDTRSRKTRQLRIHERRVVQNQFILQAYDLVNTSFQERLHTDSMQPYLVQAIGRKVYELERFMVLYHMHKFMRVRTSGTTLLARMWELHLRLMMFLHQWHRRGPDDPMRTLTARRLPWVCANGLAVTTTPLWDYTADDMLVALRALLMRIPELQWSMAAEPPAHEQFEQYIKGLEAGCAHLIIIARPASVHNRPPLYSQLAAAGAGRPEMCTATLAFINYTAGAIVGAKAHMARRASIVRAMSVELAHRRDALRRLWARCIPYAPETALAAIDPMTPCPARTHAEATCGDSPTHARCPWHLWIAWFGAEVCVPTRGDAFWRTFSSTVCERLVRPADDLLYMEKPGRTMIMRGTTGLLTIGADEAAGHVLYNPPSWQRVLSDCYPSAAVQYVYNDMLKSAECRDVRFWLPAELGGTAPAGRVMRIFQLAMQLTMVDSLFAARGAARLPWSRLCYVRESDFDTRAAWLQSIDYPIVLELASGNEFVVLWGADAYTVPQFFCALVLWSGIMWLRADGGPCVIEDPTGGRGGMPNSDPSEASKYNYDVTDVLQQFHRIVPSAPDVYTARAPGDPTHPLFVTPRL